ncbi:hypothetical protein ACTXT7_009604 [Hymenolepis weldensis]
MKPKSTGPPSRPAGVKMKKRGYDVGGEYYNHSVIMSQYLPGRDIDSFCPRTLLSTTLDTELDVQTNQNASVFRQPSSRNLDGALKVGLNNEYLEKNINRSLFLSDVAVIGERHPASIDNQPPNQSPVFEEEQISTRMNPLEISDNSLLLQECEEINVPAGPIHSNETVKLGEEDDNNSSVISPHKSSILEETDKILPMMCEQDQSLQHSADTYICAEDVSGENKPPVQSNIEENHYLSDLDNRTAPETAEHNSSFQFPQPSPILEDDEATSPLHCEQEPSSQGSYTTQVCAKDSPNEYDSRVQSNVEGYHSPSKLDESSLTGLRRPLSPEVVSLAGPRKQIEEQERQKTRLPRRASLVAREAIGLSMKALFTPTKLTSDRINAFSDFTQSTMSSSRQRSPEVAENSFEHLEEILRRSRPGRRASQVARDSINLKLVAINTSSQIPSNRAFINDSESGRRSASYDEWSVDSSSNNGSCKLILRRVNRTLQTDVESASSCSSPRARSLPHILRSSQTKSNVSTPLSSIEETEDENADTPKAKIQERSRDNILTGCRNNGKETLRSLRSKSSTLRERSRNIPTGDESDDDETPKQRRRKSVENTVESPVQKKTRRRIIMDTSNESSSSNKENVTESPHQKNRFGKRTIAFASTEPSPDKVNKGDTLSKSEGVWRLLNFDSSDSASSVTADDAAPNASRVNKITYPSTEPDDEATLAEMSRIEEKVDSSTKHDNDATFVDVPKIMK